MKLYREYSYHSELNTNNNYLRESESESEFISSII